MPDPFAYADVHLPSLGQGVLGWDGPARRRAVRPAARSSRRASVRRLPVPSRRQSGLPENEGIRLQDLDVVLVDGEGERAAVAASDVGNQALAYPSGLRRYVGHFILNQVRFPLDEFRGVDLRDVRAVHLRFGRTEAGVIDVADAAFASGARSNA